LAVSCLFVAVVVIETKGQSVDVVVSMMKEPLLRRPTYRVKPDQPPNDQ
jgi:hypothetical protein